MGAWAELLTGRKTAAQTLRTAGYEVLVASSPSEGRQLAFRRGAGIDLLVTDVVIPGGSGPGLFTELRGFLPGLRVLFISGYPGDTLVAGGRVLGRIPLLAKPFTSQELQSRVRQVLDSSTPQDVPAAKA